ncbi:DUF2799 domain-containing protein [Gallaecimonas sp. GXIMD4217]|uniref:DUF2799 domain-containing protein n=1 Tax=Gallaecimonas sp. GXIMD4217 TaxID=3131927 RepID=UPI00311AC8A1
MKHGLLITTALIIGLSGCSISPQDGVAMDGQAKGLADGTQGLVAQSDSAAYLQGWQRGNAEYCQPENGYQVGKLGQEYQGSCQGDLAAEFLARYQDGHKQYLHNRIRHVESQLHGIRLELTKKATTQQRFVKDEFKREQAGNNSLKPLQMDMHRLEKELKALRHTLQSYG